MRRTEFSWTNTDQQKIFAQEWRPAATPRGVVALMHGLGEYSGRYQHVAETLNEAGFGMVGFDAPGHGNSEGKRGHTSFDSILEHLDHLIEEAKQRYPGLPCFLYGHSMGGAITLYYLLKRKPEIRGAVVTSPGLAPGAPVAPAKLLAARMLSRLMPSFTMKNGLDVENLSQDAAIIQAYKGDPLVHPMISTRLGLDLLTLGEWIMAHAGELCVPLLLVQGSGDHIVSPRATEAFAKAAPPDKITYKIWEGLFHETHNELKKQQVLEYMTAWIDQHA